MDTEHSVIGFRAWHPKSDGSVGALYGDYQWVKGVNEAVCHSSTSWHSASSIPAAYCACGLYAMHDWINVGAYAWRSAPPVFGIARGWGQIRSHYHGWRAQYAEIAAIADLSNPVKAKAAAEYYEVPLIPFTAMPDIASEFGKPVPANLRPKTFRTEPTYGEILHASVLSLTGLVSACIQHLRKLA